MGSSPTMPIMYQIYILQSLKDKRTYIGYTSDLDARLKEHNLGKVAATRNRRPFKILYTENMENLAAWEKYI